MDIKEQAKQDYLAGTKYKDIATKYNVPVNTLKSWRKRYGWKKDATDELKEVHLLKKNASKVAPQKLSEKAVDELAESDLTEKQKAFVMEYVRLSNATQAYINAYDVAYKTAMVNGSALLRNTKVQAAIAELRKAKFKELSIGVFDLIEDLAKEARADIGDFVEFGQHTYDVLDDEGKQEYDANGQPVQKYSSWVQFKDNDKVDTSLIKNISMGKDGPHIELYDRDNARKQLIEYFNNNESNSGVTINVTVPEDDIDGN